ncbi:RagB/SusD family nutrient uptake outer membrane protein [Mangrovibacterium lignilyticum]|uniref:RagB/SusD family nutrient uptake outer membrane protein n=1 Tax=Mangrovibacterium lignilyticum TaxID=2668052 RepID=UPI0013D1AECB|nr:RagB/SusD family nutrient uptake outer membrane protein [Mangrovibacterium lignilyticum]
MKNILKHITLGLAILTAFNSCSEDFLKEAGPIDRFGDNIYESENLLNRHVATLYTYYFSGFTSPDRNLVGVYTNMPSRLTEERGGGISSYKWIQTNASYSTGDDSMFPSYIGPDRLSSSVTNYSYDRIRYVTDVLEKIDAYGADYLSEKFRNEVKGQMYYLRALQYYDLMKVYGGVPIVTSVQNSSSDDESIKIPRSTTGETVAQIISDLDMAAQLLPGTWSDPASDYGRPTSCAALAQKVRVLLTYASPLFNPNWEDASRWQDVVNAGMEAETALEAEGYGLYGSSVKDWEEMLSEDAYSASSNMEAIVIQLLNAPESGSSNAYQNNWENGLRLASQGGSGGVAVPRDMIDLFPMADGSRPTPGNGYDSFKFFLNRDPRFYRTFAFNGVIWPYQENTADTLYTYMWQSGSTNYFAGENDNIQSPVFVRKMSGNASASSTNYSLSGINIMEYRYAEFLLIMAEGYAGVGNTAMAAEYINRVRNRVGAGEIDNPNGKMDAFNAVLYERQVELAYEGKRYWDMQRWMLFNDGGDEAITTNNTCNKIGVEPMAGGARRGYFLKYTGTVSGKDDPIAEANLVAADPNSANFQSQLEDLGAWYDANFEEAELSNYMDQYLQQENVFTWNNNYYVSGFRSNLLTQNDWLVQTKGWSTETGAAGTFDFQAE